MSSIEDRSSLLKEYDFELRLLTKFQCSKCLFESDSIELARSHQSYAEGIIKEIQETKEILKGKEAKVFFFEYTQDFVWGISSNNLEEFLQQNPPLNKKPINVSIVGFDFKCGSGINFQINKDILYTEKTSWFETQDYYEICNDCSSINCENLFVTESCAYILIGLYFIELSKADKAFAIKWLTDQGVM